MREVAEYGGDEHGAGGRDDQELGVGNVKFKRPIRHTEAEK